MPAAALSRAQASGGLVHVVIDVMGLKVFGAGEWAAEKHGARGRGHPAAFDRGAERGRRHRARHVQPIRDKGRISWQKATGYGRRSLGETAMSRYKAVIGGGLRARTLPAQKTEVRVGCTVLNRVTRLGRPTSRRFA